MIKYAEDTTSVVSKKNTAESIRALENNIELAIISLYANELKINIEKSTASCALTIIT